MHFKYMLRHFYIVNLNRQYWNCFDLDWVTTNTELGCAVIITLA